MKTRKFLLAATAILSAFALSLTSCKKEGGLTLSTNYATVNVGETLQVTLSSDGADVTSQAEWTIMNTEFATIEAGLITGVKAGQTTFQATYNGESIIGDVVVSDPTPDTPAVTPVQGGITVMISIPEGSDCNGAPIWGGNTTDWSGKSFTQAEGGWWRLDISAEECAAIAEGAPSADNPIQGKPLARPEGFAEGGDLGNWPTQLSEYEVLPATTVKQSRGENFEISSTGIFWLWVKSWQNNPCASADAYTINMQLPACTPADQTVIYILGNVAASADGDMNGWNWAAGEDHIAPIEVPIVAAADGSKSASVTVYGQATSEWKPFLTSGDWDSGPAECKEDGTIGGIANFTLGSMGDHIVLSAWEGVECGLTCEPAAAE